MQQLTLHLRTRLVIGLVIFLAASLSGCGAGYSASTGGTTLSSITITPSSAMIINGTTATLTATGSYSNGTSADITSLVTWSSANSATASVAAGVVTANAIGTTSVTASMNDGYGVMSDTAPITVTGASVISITISPLTPTLTQGTTTILTATGGFSDSTSGNISGSATWTSSNPAVATVNASGIATAVGPGISTITATLGSVSNTASLKVN